jgi:hypothetical protein
MNEKRARTEFVSISVNKALVFFFFFWGGGGESVIKPKKVCQKM